MTENKNRCVITGLGMICAVGADVRSCWESALAGKSGIAHTHTLDTENCYADYAAEVSNEYLPDAPEAERMDRAARLGIHAAKEALADAGLGDFAGDHRASVIMGSCVGGVVSIEHYYTHGKDPKDILKMPISAIASQVAESCHAGGVVTNIANACAAGTMSIAYASDLIRAGKADVVVAGGADGFASVPYAGFLSLHALDAQPCSPFNRSSGITLGEGAGAVIVESYEHAMTRGAHIYCEVLGSGISSDAHHITAPRPDGEGQMNAIREAIASSGLTEADVGYVNAHGTGTAKNDQAEFLSLHTIFDGKNDELSVSSTKGMTGHCLGAAGAIEAVFAVKALTENMVPPTLGFREEDMALLAERAGKMDFCPNKPHEKQLSAVMDNSFAFGGNNASLIFGKGVGEVHVPTEKKEIVITGAGVVSPLGNGLDTYLANVKGGKRIDAPSVRSAVDTEDYAAVGLERSFYRKLDHFSQLQAVCGMQALQNAGYTITEENAVKTGILVGTSEGALAPGCDFEELIAEKGNAGGSAFKFPNTVYNAAGGYLSICAGIKGYNVTVTNGGQSGLSSMAYAVNVLRAGKAEAMVATGTDENCDILDELFHGIGYVADHVPTPYEGAEGFALSDGSVSLLLEDAVAAEKRGATALCRVCGFGMAHKAVPFGKVAGSGEALDAAVRNALEDAGLTLEQMDAVVGFANGMTAVDNEERAALARLFGDRLAGVPVLSVKERFGEGRAASAAMGALHAALLLHGDLQTDDCAYNLAGKTPVKVPVCGAELRHILVLAVGAGGSYTALILGKN